MNEWSFPDSSSCMHSTAITAAKVHTHETIQEEIPRPAQPRSLISRRFASLVCFVSAALHASPRLTPSLVARLILFLFSNTTHLGLKERYLTATVTAATATTTSHTAWLSVLLCFVLLTVLDNTAVLTKAPDSARHPRATLAPPPPHAD